MKTERPGAVPHSEADRPSPTWGVLAALVFTGLFPTALTWLYFVQLADASTVLQQTAYAVGKTVQFAFPALFTLFVLRRAISFRSASGRHLVEGAISGLAILTAVLLFYGLLGRLDSALLSSLAPRVAAKVSGLGVGTPGRYLALGAFYSLVHSFLEEYYWRWFVYGRLRRLTGAGAAIAVSSAAFAAHHLILMGFYAGWDSPFTYVFTLAVAIGGTYWAWLYERSRSVVPVWISHLFVDAAIFTVGWSLL